MLPSVAPTASPSATPTAKPTSSPTAAPTYIPKVAVKGVAVFSGNALLPFTKEKRAKLIDGVASSVGVAKAEISITRSKSDTSNFFTNQVIINLAINCPDQSHAESIATIMNAASFSSFLIDTLAHKEGIEVPSHGMILKHVTTEKVKEKAEGGMFASLSDNQKALATSFVELFIIFIIFIIFICVLRYVGDCWDDEDGEETDMMHRKAKKSKGYGALKSAQRIYSPSAVVVPTKSAAHDDGVGDWERDKAEAMANSTTDDFAMEDV
jgi:hypothetical protein